MQNEHEHDQPTDEHDPASMTTDEVRDALAAERRRCAETRIALRQMERRVTEHEAALAVAREEVEREHAERMRELLAENVARRADLPESFAKRLRGSTREELEADAVTVRAMLEGRHVEFSHAGEERAGRGGLTPGGLHYGERSWPSNASEARMNRNVEHPGRW